MMKQTIRKTISWVLQGFMAAAALVMAAALAWYYFFGVPCRMEADCRGRGVEAEALKQWEETEEGRSMGIRAIAGWRVEEQEIVSSVSTGRRQRSRVTAVYGSMDLVLPGKILDMGYGMDGQEGYCVVTSGLASCLFGSTAVSGECIRAGGRYFIIGKVVENQEAMLLIPMDEGSVEYVAAKFETAVGAGEKMRRIMEALDF